MIHENTLVDVKPFKKYLEKDIYKKLKGYALWYRYKKDRLKPNVLEDAYETFPHNFGIVHDLVHHYLRIAKESKAQKILKRFYEYFPHRDIISLYLLTLKKLSPAEQFKKVKDFVKGAENQEETLIGLTQLALKGELWGVADKYINRLIQDYPSQRAYTLKIAYLEAQIPKDQNMINTTWKQYAMARPDHDWQCQECGTHMDRYSLHCRHCHAVDCAEWGIGQKTSGSLLFHDHDTTTPPTLLSYESP